MDEFHETLTDGTVMMGWKSQPPGNPFAPNYEHYLTEKQIFSVEECKEWNDYLLEQEKIIFDKHRLSTGSGNTGLNNLSITARYAYYNLLKFDFYLVERLKTELLNGIKTILEISDNTRWKETLHANSWFNVMHKGDFMQQHSHGSHKDAFYGFHVNITSQDTFTSYYHPIKFRQETFHVPNKLGSLTLFPEFVPHDVSANRYDTPRISIAGDIFTSAWLGLNTNTAEDGNAQVNNIDPHNEMCVELGSL